MTVRSLLLPSEMDPTRTPKLLVSGRSGGVHGGQLLRQIQTGCLVGDRSRGNIVYLGWACLRHHFFLVWQTLGWLEPVIGHQPVRAREAITGAAAAPNNPIALSLPRKVRAAGFGSAQPRLQTLSDSVERAPAEAATLPQAQSATSGMSMPWRQMYVDWAAWTA